MRATPIKEKERPSFVLMKQSDIQSVYHTLRGVLLYLAIPLALYILFALVLRGRGEQFLAGHNLKIFAQNVAYMGLIGFAVSLHVPATRFDFSVGAVMVLSNDTPMPSALHEAALNYYRQYLVWWAVCLTA